MRLPMLFAIVLATTPLAAQTRDSVTTAGPALFLPLRSAPLSRAADANDP